MSIIFISLPYSSETDSLREWRYKQCLDYALEMTKQGHVVVAPVLSGHHLAEEAKKRKIDIPSNHWYYVIDAHCKDHMEMHVLKLWGWDKSNGVHYEILKAQEHEMKIKYIESTWAYTTPDYLTFLTTGDIDRVTSTVEYILCESDDDYMIAHGIPSTDQVQLWIDALKKRSDHDSIRVRFAIKECEAYVLGVAE